MAIKPSLVEHIFRRVWAQQAGALEAEARRGGDESDGESTADDADTATARTAASVTKINSDALKMSSEFLRLFVVEALRRAQMEAMIDDSKEVEPHHLEQIVAQLLLDF